MSISLTRGPQSSRSTLGGTKFKTPGDEKKETEVKSMRVDGG